MMDERFIPVKRPDLSTCHPEDARWAAAVERETGDVHVMPLNDSRKHSVVGCECTPTLDKTEGGNKMFIHQAFDGRKS